MVQETEHQVLARKWRPKQFNEVVGQQHVVRTLTNALTNNTMHHAYLFTGTRGIGKTTLARILAKCLNCEKGMTADPCGICSHCVDIDKGCFPDLYEVDAASRTKVEDTRELLDNVQYAPAAGRYKIYLIDEVHMLSNHSFNALLKTLEEPPSHVKFLLATTDPQKLPATVLSRCLQFHLTAMSPEHIAQHLAHLLEHEHITFEPEALTLIGKAAKGSMRDSLSLLDQAIAYGNATVTTADITHMLGLIESSSIHAMLQAIHDNDANQLLQLSEKLSEQGAHYHQALNDLLSLLHSVSIAQAITDVSSSFNKSITELAQMLSKEDTQLYYQIGLMGQRDLPFAPSPRSGFEMTLLRMLAFKPGNTITTTTQNREIVAKSRKKPESIQKEENKANSISCEKQPSTEDNQWLTMVPALNLSGLTRIIADNCSLIAFENDKIQLNIHPNKSSMLQPDHTKLISEAVSKHLNRTIAIEISANDTISVTPAKQHENKLAAKQAANETSIQSDPNVKQILKTFDATVIKESITSLKD